MMWRTKLTQSFPCQLPLMGAPMAGVSGGLLAAETARAGALGFVAAGHLQSLETINEEISIFRQQAPSDAPLGVGFIGHSALKNSEGWKRFEALLQQHKPDLVQFFAPSIIVRQEDQRTNVEIAHEYGCLVMAQVGNVQEAQQALDAGVDALIAQGSEAGGHGLRRELANGTLPLAARLTKLAAARDIPVLAAGGIVDGRGVAAALALGCDGAVLGTRLWVTHEALGRESSKQVLASSATEPDNVFRSTVPDLIDNSYSKTPWPNPYDSVGCLRNDFLEKWDLQEFALAQELASGNSKVASDFQKANGDPNIASVLTGQGVGDIHSLESAHSVIQRINDEAIAIIRNLPTLLVD